MPRVFGFDIGTTSVGFAVIDHDQDTGTGTVLRMGVRVFPEARDADGTPLNQQRRQKRMARRQLRRRRTRRRRLNEILSEVDLLPKFGSKEWGDLMETTDPYELRKRGLSEALSPHELGRALYHLAQRRHFKGRDLQDEDEVVENNDKQDDDNINDEKKATAARESTLAALKTEEKTLGTWLAEKEADARKGQIPTEKRRGIHAHRSVVEDEFKKLWDAQTKHHVILKDQAFRFQVEDVIFAQRPVFWRRNTLGRCPFMPGEPLCPKGAWLSHQRRMLEKLNNLALAGGNQRPLDQEERAAVLAKLQGQASMSWGAVRNALKPLYKARGEAGAERSLKFNLELGGDAKLLGNLVEAKLAGIFSSDWDQHPCKRAIRDAVHQRLWSADYGEIGTQRVVVLPERERRMRRIQAAQSFIDDFGVSREQASRLEELRLPTGWEPYSTKALQAFMPHLERGLRFGALVNGPEWEDRRNETFPNRDRPTGEVLDRLPSPAAKEERDRIASLRNPTVVRTQNELRKVVNNLISLFGKPDLIRVEVARDVGKSKREREEIQSGIRRQEKRRKEAVKDLESKGITEPSRDDVEKWLLWKEGQERCPYTGDQIGFDALFREGRYEVEHIRPRSRSFDDSFRNKTLCRKDINLEKNNQTPFEYLGHDPDRWAAIQTRLDSMIASKGGTGLPPSKVKRFLAESLPADFASRQLNDTSYASRQAIAFLKRLWPDLGPEAPVTVQAVTGRVTAQLRRLWGLNNILADDGEKTRADHRHHAIDALTVACVHPGMTNRLSRYWQAKDDRRTPNPELPPPWPTIRADAERAVKEIVVSHRVRRKVSGPLHRETVYGDTGQDVMTKRESYRLFVTRKKVEALGKGELDSICDIRVREIVAKWVNARGGDPKKAFPPYPRLGESGPVIRKVRITVKRRVDLMVPVSTGYAERGNNHHVAIYRTPDGRAKCEVVSLFEARRRLARREPVVRRAGTDGDVFVMSLAPGDSIMFAKEKSEPIRTWYVQKIASKGQISLLEHTDASPEEVSLFEPMVGGVIARNATKISVDPIGRIRKAGD